ncbi:MAG: XRE family transcriptional regulator [Rhizomicrobium sp.]
MSPSTVVRLEAGEELKPRTVEAIKHAFEALGIEFLNGIAPGVRLHFIKRRIRQ